jgi:uncharacterized membrane protein
MQIDEMTDMNMQPAASMLPPATGSSNINVGMSERLLSVLGGAAAAFYGMKNITAPSGLAMALTGTYLLVRGASGYCPLNELLNRNTANKRTSAMEVKATLRINRPRAEVYAFWRNFENLPRFMKHLEEVREHDLLGHRSTWKAVVPGKLGTVTWDAEITEDIAGESLVWSSLPGSTIDNAGEVRFKDIADQSGTEINVCMTYRLPAGDIGGVAGKLFNPLVEKMMLDDLHSLKNILETRETTAPMNVAKPKKGRKSKSSGNNHDQEQSFEPRVF